MLVHETVQRLRRRLGYAKWRLATRLHSRRVAQLYRGDVNRVYWIEPQRIVAALDFPNDPSPIAERGVIRGGGWDRQRIEWEQFDAWQAFQQRYLQNRAWPETNWYKTLLSEILSGQRAAYGCRSQEELDRHFRSTDDLHQRIKSDGYRLQSELRPSEPPSLSLEDEVTVHIDRNGHYLFGDGRHRLFIAKVLGLRRIPVKIARRHAKWVSFRQDILDHIRGGGGKAYQPLLHPDLEDIPSVHGHDRFDVLRQHLPETRGTLLDLGTNWGYFPHRFEDLGLKCTGVESFPTELYFLRRLREAGLRRFEIIERSILDLEGRLTYDVVLALNIFHHFLKEKPLYERWRSLLARIDAKVIFFESHRPDEDQMKDSYVNYGPAEFARVVAKACRMTETKEIGHFHDGRTLYRLCR